MSSSKTLVNGSARETESAQPTLQSMNDLYSLELSQVLMQAVEAGMLQPEEGESGWIFQIEMCPAHQMVSLPKCLMCIEAEAGQAIAA